MELKKQALFNTAGSSIYLFSLWLLTVITTRLLGIEAVGTLTLSMSIGNVFAIFQLYGVRSFQSSDVSFQFSPKDYLLARCITVISGFFLCFIACLMLGYSLHVTAAVLLFLLFKTSETFSDVLFGDDQRSGRLELAGYSMILRGLLTTVLFLVGASISRKLDCALFTAAVGVLLLTLLFDLPLYHKTVQTYALSHTTCDVLKVCFPLLLSSLIPTAITAIPRIVLERNYGAELLGYYGNISSPALIISTIVPTILTAFLPGYGKAFQQRDYSIILKIWVKTSLGTLLFGAVCLFGAFLLGRPILSFVYTNAILPYIPYLYGVIIAITIYALTMCCSNALISIRKNRTVVFSTIFALIVCVATVFPLVQSHGINGAILNLIITYGVQVLVQVICLLRVCYRGEMARKANSL